MTFPETVEKDFNYPFSEETKHVLEMAKWQAGDWFKHRFIGLPHLFLSLFPPCFKEIEDLIQGESIFRLQQKTQRLVTLRLGEGSEITKGIGLTPEAIALIDLGIGQSMRENHPCLEPNHLWQSFIKHGKALGLDPLEFLKVDLKDQPVTQTKQPLLPEDEQIRQQALGTLTRLQAIFEDPSGNQIRQQQIEMILRGGAAGLLSL